MKTCSIAIFSDTSLRTILASLSDLVGQCSYTSEKEASLMGLDIIGEQLESLFSLYRKPESEEEGIDLAEHLLGYWPGLFDVSKIERPNLTVLLDDILEQIGLGEFRSSGSGLVFIPDMDRAYQDFNLDLSSKWDRLSEELKYRNRFFLSKAINWDSIRTTLQYLGKIHPKDARFFRARISEEPIEKDTITKPPRE